MTHARTIGLAVFCGLGALAVAAPADSPVVITFDKVESGKAMPSYTDQGVVFALSRRPTTSRAAGRVMFFPHLKTPRNGILNAMANESIPVDVRFSGAPPGGYLVCDEVRFMPLADRGHHGP